MLTSTILSFFFLGQAYGSLVGDITLTKKDASLESTMRRYVDSIIEPVPVTKRQDVTSPSNVTEWNDHVLAACTAQLQTLNGVASNPSGISACYNLQYWDNTTGIFHADLRLYMVAPASGSFADIAAQQVKVDLSYSGANVSSVPNSALKRREDLPELASPELEKRQVPTPILTHSYAFYGQLHKELLTSDEYVQPHPTFPSPKLTSTSSAVEQALVPVVTLTGVNAQGQTVNTSLSTTDASFIVGAFSQKTVITQAVVAAPGQTLVAGPGEQFVMPGTKILITPVGAIVTGIWTLLFVATVGYGTVRRMQFKDQYRRRVARATAGKIVTI